MPTQQVTLREVTRDDVARIRRWLEDDEVSEMWFGRYSYGDPAHLGYHPEQMESAKPACCTPRYRDTDKAVKLLIRMPAHRFMTTAPAQTNYGSHSRSSPVKR